LTETGDKYNQLITLLGEKKIEKLHYIMGSEKISFAALRNFIKRREIVNAIKERADISIIARESVQLSVSNNQF